MKNSIRSLCAFLISGLLGLSAASASTVVIFHGEEIDPQVSGSMLLVGQNDFLNQGWGAQFSLIETTIITSIEAWLYGSSFPEFGVGTFTASIHADAATKPGAELFSNDFNAPNSAAWAGLSGNLVTLDAGLYWLVLSADANNQGFVGIAAHPPTGLQLNTFDNGATWSPDSGGELSLRVRGETMDVPETINCAGALLFGSIVCAWFRRRRAVL